MRAVVRVELVAPGDRLTGFDGGARALEPSQGFTIGPSIYADAVLTTSGGTRRAIGGRRCCGFFLDPGGALWLRHGGRLSHLAVNGEAFERGSRTQVNGDSVEIRTAAGDVSARFTVRIDAP